jgi:hypothetical protein
MNVDESTKCIWPQTVWKLIQKTKNSNSHCWTWAHISQYPSTLIQGPYRGWAKRNSLQEKKNFKRRLSQYAQRAGFARKLLQCVLIQATWPHLCLDNHNATVQSGRNHRFCHAGMSYCRSFRTFAENSPHFAFVSLRFVKESIAHILTVECFVIRVYETLYVAINLLHLCTISTSWRMIETYLEILHASY